MSVSRAKIDLLLICASGIIGFFGLSSSLCPLRLATPILAVPVLWGLASGRKVAFGVMLAYFLAVSRGLLPGAAVFLSEDHTFMQASGLYFLMSFGVSLPFLLFWSKDKRRKALCLPVAVLTAFVLPPISLIGIVSPLLAAGTILRGFGYLGMLLVLIIWSLCAVERRIAPLLLCAIFAFTVLPGASWYETAAPEGFLAVDTSFGRLGSGSHHFARDYERVQFVFDDLRRRNLQCTGAKFFVLPETIAGRLNPTGFALWRQELAGLLENGGTVIFGGEIPTDGGRKYDNAVIMLHKEGEAVLFQRIPVPYSMYRGPSSVTGANLHLFDEDGILELPDGRSAAIVVCYEAYLTWPYLVSMRLKPDMIISVANLWWCRDSSLPTTQRTVVALWGLLFGVPTLFTANL